MKNHTYSEFVKTGEFRVFMIDLILLKDSKLKISRNLFVRLGAFIKLIEMVGPNDWNSTVMYQIDWNGLSKRFNVDGPR